LPQENPSLREQDLGDVLVRIDDGEGDTVAPPPAQLVDAVQVKVRIEPSIRRKTNCAERSVEGRGSLGHMFGFAKHRYRRERSDRNV
jgi:hypothetical protein